MEDRLQDIFHYAVLTQALRKNCGSELTVMLAMVLNKKREKFLLIVSLLVIVTSCIFYALLSMLSVAGYR